MSDSGRTIRSAAEIAGERQALRVAKKGLQEMTAFDALACDYEDLTRQRDNLRDALVAAEGRLLSPHVQGSTFRLGAQGEDDIKWALDIIQMALLPYRSEAFKEVPAESTEAPEGTE